MARPLSKRLLVVTGKGGVGKSTVAAALGVAAAGAGLRTIVAEVAARADVTRLLGAEQGLPLEEVELSPRLHHVSIARREATEEYLREETPGPLPAAILARSRAFELFVAATPGLSELLTVGKAFELTRRPRRMKRGEEYDLVVLDAPSSGNATALLSSPKTFAEVARVGPVASKAREIEGMLADHDHTGVILVSTGEQMAVSETLELRESLAKLRMQVDAVVANRVVDEPLDANEAASLAEVAADDPAIRSARWLQARGRSQSAHLKALREGLRDERWLTLPFLLSAELRAEDVDALAAPLAEGLR